MSARKSDAERANVNARSALSTLRTLAAQLAAIDRHLIQPGHAIEPGTLDALARSAYRTGFSAAVRDLTD